MSLYRRISTGGISIRQRDKIRQRVSRMVAGMVTAERAEAHDTNPDTIIRQKTLRAQMPFPENS